MRILVITDQYEGARHSAIDGIFNRYLKDQAEVDAVYFSRESKLPEHTGERIVLPHRYRRRNVVKGLQGVVDLSRYDFVIVRNLFGLLADFLKARTRHSFKLGFWESFPHSYRRVYEARQTGKSVLRKTVEYAIRKRIEQRLVERCDFYLPITETFKTTFHPDLSIPCHALPMGVDFSLIAPPDEVHLPEGPTKFLYIGTVDRLRRLDLVVSAFARLEDDFLFDLYTPSDNDLVGWIKSIGDPRIRVHSAQPREALFRIMPDYDVGIGIIPDTLLYRVSSPTKTLEYYAAGIPALMNHLPEYDQLFAEDTAFFCELGEESILEALQSILRMARPEIRQTGKRGQAAVKQARDYEVMAEELYGFFHRRIMA